VNSGYTFRFNFGTAEAYLSPQPLLDTCLHKSASVSCSVPVTALRPGSLLIGWYDGWGFGGFPTKPVGASAFSTAGGDGWISTHPLGCTELLGDEEMVVELPSKGLEIRACLRGPNLKLLEYDARSIMRSTH
jgi:hypothetical protein